MKKGITTFLSLSLFFSSNINANPLNLLSTGSLFYMVGLGVDNLIAEGHDSVSTGPGWPNDLYKSKDNHTFQPLLTLGVGYTFRRGADTLPFYSFGINYSYISSEEIKGKILQYSLREFTNYHYRYKIERQALMAFTKIDLYRYRNLLPFLKAGIGISYNKVKGFHESALADVTPRLSPGFRDRSALYLSFLAGLGVDAVLSRTTWLTLEYNYNFISGKVKTDHGKDLATLTDYNYGDNSLRNRIRSGAIILSLNYYPCPFMA